MNTLLQKIQERTEREIKESEDRIAYELRDFDESLKRRLIGAQALSEKDMNAVAERMRYALRTLQQEVLTQAEEVQKTMREMQDRHQLWRSKGDWRFTVMPMGIGALLVVVMAMLVFAIMPRPVQTRVEIQPPQNGLERSVRVMAIGGAGTVLVLPAGVEERPCPLMTPADRICVRTPRTEN
jgi:predicted transcriptional regulator